MKEKIVLRVGSQVDDLSMSALFGGVGGNCNSFNCGAYCNGKCACFCATNKNRKCSTLWTSGLVEPVSLGF